MAHSERGSALIIVLALIALIMVLVLAVLETGAASKKQSATITAQVEADALERIPAQIIITQLQRATTQTITNEGERLTWASQPGMIRVFGMLVTKGDTRPKAKMHYRLYSASVMNSADLDLAQEVLTMNDWDTKPAGFTDLNQPVVGTRTPTPALLFPIADAQALGRVDGFAVRSTAPHATELQPLPMPVAWIYVLRDGTFAMPASLDGAMAKFAADLVSQDNPIIGRIAFWTDDETCKLNLNTASEAAAWDTPGANTQTDRANASHPPSATESYRISGHPAFTSLSPVLKSFGDASIDNLQWPKPESVDKASAWQRYLDCYQALVPHGVGTDLVARQDRHFATVDEFFFDPQRERNGKDAGFLMAQSDLTRSRFFLTTRSTSPELNPFGGPKIALWMMPQDKAARTEMDHRIALATSLNTEPAQRHEFMFQRASNWTSPTTQGSSQSMPDDWAQVPRNRELYAWLQTMSSQPMPGFGGRFIDKYGTRNRDQILTSMLDLLRWGSNTTSSLPPTLGSANPQGLAEQSSVPLVPVMDARQEAGTTLGFGRFPTLTEITVVFAFTDVERVNGKPRDDNKDGICDRATKLRAFIVLNPFVPACGTPGASPAWSVRIRRLQQWTLGAGISPQLPGGNVRNRCTLSASQMLDAHQPWGGNVSPYACFASQFIQASGSPKEIGKRDDPGRDFPFVSLNDVTLQAPSGAPGSNLKFSGGRIIVDLMEPNAAQAQPQPNDAIHSIEVEFPLMQLPMPQLAVADFNDGPRKLGDRLKPIVIGKEVRLPLLQRGDIVRSMVLNPNGPAHGDARLLAARRELLYPEAANWFVLHSAATTNPSQAMAQSLRDGAYMTTGQYGAPTLQATSSTAGSLLPNINYASNAVPAVPLGLQGATVPAIGSDPGGRLGDWESGAGVFEDGPFVSRTRMMPEASFTRGSFASTNNTSDVEPLSELASAISFGAIPSGIYGDSTSTTPRPWQTLLFCPNPVGRITPASSPGHFDNTAHDHFGFASPPDHLWLEFFTMPVTKPWPMTTNFATEGKVNLNHQLMPFTWMQRATALHGALKGVRITAIPTAALTSTDSAKGKANGDPLDATFRYEVDADKTVQGINQRLDAGDVFRSTSEICEQCLVPKRIASHTYDGDSFSPRDPAHLHASDMIDWWNGDASNPADAFEATGDNLREAPYAQLYPRLCTQSNVYRVHYRVQVLRKARTTKPEEWDETTDTIVAERRGSTVIERQLAKPTAPLPDSATDSTAPSLHQQQTFHIIAQEAFQP